MLAASLALAAATGCAPTRIGGTTPPDQALNELRVENHQLATQVQTLQTDIDRRLAEIQQLKQQTTPRPADPALANAELPRLTTLKLDRYSAALDTDRDGGDDAVRLYVRTLDQLGRFLPVGGKLSVRLINAHAQPPTVIAQTTLDPASLDKAYRSGLTGTHYTVQLPLPQPTPAELRQITVVVELTDAQTGATVTLQEALPVTPGTTSARP